MPADWSLLAEHLRSSGLDVVTVTWDELDRIVGGVPDTAGRHRPWWSGRRQHVLMWRAAGYRRDRLVMGVSVTFVRASAEAAPASLAAGDSRVQRRAEIAMVARLSEELGEDLQPRRLTSPGGAYAEVDAVADDGRVMAECWAHQGSAKVAQKYKLVNDAAKLQWVASWHDPVPERLLICVSDEAAVKHLRGTSWQGRAIAAMGVEIVVVELDTAMVDDLRSAQVRQYR